jgi:hypothetical protein
MTRRLKIYFVHTYEIVAGVFLTKALEIFREKTDERNWKKDGVDKVPELKNLIEDFKSMSAMKGSNSINMIVSLLRKNNNNVSLLGKNINNMTVSLLRESINNNLLDPASQDKVHAIQNDVNETRDILHNNIQQLMDRGMILFT